jgi:hypothetical protein
VLRFLHTLSASLFYLLGSSFFLAYILYHNSIAGTWPLMWLETADLPLLICALLYGGLSVYLSFGGPDRPSKIAAALLAAPLVVTFLIFAILNFLF